MNPTPTFEITSQLDASPADVWRHTTHMRTLNLEFRPVLKMTYPRQYEDLGRSATQLGQVLFRSWILLFGCLPIDYYDVTFVAFEEGRRFVERSPTFTSRLWQHERIIQAGPAGTWLTDRLTVAARWHWMETLYERLVRLLFRLRHKNLCRLYGECAKAPRRERQ